MRNCFSRILLIGAGLLCAAMAHATSPPAVVQPAYTVEAKAAPVAVQATAKAIKAEQKAAVQDRYAVMAARWDLMKPSPRPGAATSPAPATSAATPRAPPERQRAAASS